MPFHIRLISLLGILAIVSALSYGYLFGPVAHTAKKQEILITPEETLEHVAMRLEGAGLVRNHVVFELAYVHQSGGVSLRPGGYYLSPSMDVWSAAETLSHSPYVAWVTIPRGRRKEEIADILATKLAWTEEEKKEWLTKDTAPSENYSEGVYFPGTYLIPSDQRPAQVAERMRSRFRDEYEQFAEAAKEKGLAWNDVVTMASLIEREAAGAHDMPLIAGIMWNRLNKGMKLQIDASLQYVKGTEATGWWGVVKSEDKYLASAYNTYQHVGLPPGPIANPAIDSLRAVVNPEKTSCLFYLHDYHGVIHCSPTYSGHVANIRKYLQ